MVAPFPASQTMGWFSFLAVYKAKKLHTKFTSGAHYVIAFTVPQKNDLCTEGLRDRAHLAKSLNEVSLPLYTRYLKATTFIGLKRYRLSFTASFILIGLTVASGKVESVPFQRPYHLL